MKRKKNEVQGKMNREENEAQEKLSAKKIKRKENELQGKLSARKIMCKENRAQGKSYSFSMLYLAAKLLLLFTALGL